MSRQELLELSGAESIEPRAWASKFLARIATGNSELTCSSYIESRFRRSCDVVLSLLLLILLAPLLLVIALAIKATSPGPVLFKQSRHGRGMRPFKLLKFRSMRWVGAEETDVAQALEADPRVTFVGNLLRRTSLDELPQLINVLAGDMSLIGPRPHAVEHDLVYMEQVQNYARRFQIRPGLTGLAQVSGARGWTPSLEHMYRRVELDLAYLERASLRLDCGILLRTVKEFLDSRSAW